MTHYALYQKHARKSVYQWRRLLAAKHPSRPASGFAGLGSVSELVRQVDLSLPFHND
jgi:hypothetical protein